MSITTSTQWDSLASASREAPIPLVRLYYGNESNYVSISNQDIELDGERFIGLLLNFPSQSSKIDIFSHESSVGTVSLELSNLEYQQDGSRFSDFMTTLGSANDYGFYNRKVEVKLYIPGITSWANCFPLFTGYVRDIKQSREKVIFDCEDGSELQHVTIPDDIFQEADAVSNTVIPESAYGKTRPIIYGDHTLVYADEDVARDDWQLSQVNNIVPIIKIGVDNENNYYLVSNHVMYSIDSIWAYDSSINRYVKATDFTVEQNTSSGCIVSLPRSDDGDLLDSGEAVSDITTEGNSVASWTGFNATISSVTSSEGFSPYAGTYMMKLVETNTTNGAYQSVSVTENVTYTAKAWLYDTDIVYGTTVVGCSLRVGTTAGGNELGESAPVTSEDEWQYREVSFSATSGTIYVSIYKYTGGPYYADKVSLTNSRKSFYDYWFGNGTVSEGTALSDWANPAYSVDQDKDTYAYLDNSSGDAFGRHYGNFDEWDRDGTSDSDIKEVRIYAFTKRTGTPPTSTSPAGAFEINDTEVGGNIDDQTAIDCGVVEASLSGISGGVEFRWAQTSATGNTGTIYEIWKRIQYFPSDSDNIQLFASCKGYEYGTWINSRTGHVDNNDSGEMIENAAGILESILRDHMGLATADIDTSAFNTLSSNLSDYNLAFYLSENIDTKELIQKICKETRCYLWQKSDRTWTAKYLPDNAASATLVIDHDDIISDVWDTSSLSELKTTIKVNYLYNNNSGSNQLEDTFSNSTNRTYYNITLAQGTLIIETFALKDSTASGNLKNFELRNRKALHNMPTIELDKQYHYLDIGDYIQFKNMPYLIGGEDIEADASRAGQDIEKEFFIVEVERGESMRLVAFQIHGDTPE